MCGCLSHAPYWERGPQPRPVPSPGIHHLLVRKSAISPLSHTSQDITLFLMT